MNIPEVMEAATVGPDQVLVLRVKGALPESMLEALKGWAADNALEGRILVLDETTEMAVVEQ